MKIDITSWKKEMIQIIEVQLGEKFLTNCIAKIIIFLPRT